MAYSVRKEQKKQLDKEIQKAARDVRKSLAPNVQQYVQSKRAKLTIMREVRKPNEQPSTNTLRPKRKLKKTAKPKKT